MQTFTKGWTSDSGTTLFTQGWVFFENDQVQRKRTGVAYGPDQSEEDDLEVIGLVISFLNAIR